jgi:hypothetical protein
MKKVALGIIVVLVVAAGGYFAYIYRMSGTAQGAAVATAIGDIVSNDTSSESSDASTTAPAALAEIVPTTKQVTQDMRGYENKSFHFGLLYPQELKATEYKEKGGALTVSFQNPSTNEGFQVYVTPFSGKQIDTARFKLDEPSGVMQSPTDVWIDCAPPKPCAEGGGVKATMFLGKNAVMGDTREVWFIHGGYLYEVTTYKDLDSWLGGVMQTWKFI